MESLNIIQYKYKMGAISIEQLVRMVENQEISEEDFFQITRKNYKGFKEVHKLY